MIAEPASPAELEEDGHAALRGLVPVLARLDARLARAAARVPAAYGAHVDGDRYRGLYVAAADVTHLLGREPGAATLASVDDKDDRDDRDDGDDGDGVPEGNAPSVPDGSALAWLANAFGLDRFDVDVLVLAIAPDVDLRYERLYAYLHDDVARRRPSVDLALNVLCTDAADRIRRRAHFAPGAPLVRHRLVDVVAPAGGGPLLAHTLEVDEQIVNLVLGQDALDRRLADACRYVVTDVVLGSRVLDADTLARVVAVVRDGGARRRLHFHGPRGAGKRAAASAIAATLEVPLLDVDVARLAQSPDFARLIALALRDAWLRDGIAYLRGVDALLRDDRSAATQLAALESALDASPAVAIVSTTRPWPAERAAGGMDVAFGTPAYAQRRALWTDAIRDAGLTAVADDTLDALAARFRLTPRQIALAVDDAAGAVPNEIEPQRAQRGAEKSTGSPLRSSIPFVVDPSALFAGARRRSAADLESLAARVKPTHTWNDLVIPDDARTQLRELCERVTYRERVVGDWGFSRVLSRGTGVNALFSGPSGTGKTMAAEVLAGALGVDLYRVELAGVVSKYIGETEKNLDRVFDAAERSNGILLFDEADALFGKRSEVHDAHDRYANVEISYLLQRMEAYDGVAILSTNLRGNLDAAFVRRLAFTVHFPFPDEASRARIWRGVWPVEVPLAADVRLDLLARQFPISGGNIKNVALAAAFLAAADGTEVTTPHLVAAIRREYQKLGKGLTASELGPFGSGVTRDV